MFSRSSEASKDGSAMNEGRLRFGIADLRRRAVFTSSGRGYRRFFGFDGHRAAIERRSGRSKRRSKRRSKIHWKRANDDALRPDRSLLAPLVGAAREGYFCAFRTTPSLGSSHPFSHTLSSHPLSLTGPSTGSSTGLLSHDIRPRTVFLRAPARSWTRPFIEKRSKDCERALLAALRTSFILFRR